MTTDASGPPNGGRRLTPADVHGVRFSRATVMRPGYSHAEVDYFLARLAEELARLTAEKAELRDRVHALEAQLDGVTAQEAPSDQAVRILSVAQQTADNYVAEAEEFSRQITTEAREQYEEQLRQARENAAAIIQAAQEAAASLAVGRGNGGVQRTAEELQEQVAYLRAFGQACRVQLRSYLEALLSDVETEWGRADPAVLPDAPLRTPAQRWPREATEGAELDAVGNGLQRDGADADRMVVAAPSR
ncbi:DivIVA domain-containing protein [Geodermatophilus sp. SYSU D00758]